MYLFKLIVFVLFKVVTKFGCNQFKSEVLLHDPDQSECFK